MLKRDDDEKLAEVRTTLDREIKCLDCKENLNKKIVANENIKENVAMQALDKTHTKSSNVIDCKDDTLENVINITDKESFQEDDGLEHKLFVYNLTKHTVDQVKSIFAKYGVVSGCKRKNIGKIKTIFHITFEDENVSIKLKSLGKIIVDNHIIRVTKTPGVSWISAEFVQVKAKKRLKVIKSIFSKFGAFKHCKKGIKKDEYGLFVAFEDERVNKMLIKKGYVDYHGHKILIKEVFYI